MKVAGLRENIQMYTFSNVEDKTFIKNVMLYHFATIKRIKVEGRDEEYHSTHTHTHIDCVHVFILSEVATGAQACFVLCG